MAYDKVVDSAVLEAGLTLIGDSIRAKGGTSAKLEFPNGMKAAVEAIDTSENLDEVLDEQDSIIEQIQAALEGKAGASVETCTVTLRGGIRSYAVTTCDNGIITYRYATANFTSTSPGVIELPNVVCNSIMAISASGNITGFSITGTSQSLNIVGTTSVLSAPTQPEECFIVIQQQSGGGGS